MEQEAFCDIGHFDEEDVHLDEAPRSAVDYLRQVIVGRKKCADVVIANTDVNQQEIQQRSSGSNVKIKTISVYAPSREWIEAKVSVFGIESQVRDFSTKRCSLERKREKVPKLPCSKFPKLNDCEGWLSFCLEERSPFVPILKRDEERFSHHLGTPPTARLVLSLSEARVSNLVQYLSEKFLDSSYSRALMEWIFAMLLVLQKPLQQDVCASMRSMVRHARALRETFEPPDGCNSPIVLELSYLIAIVSVYFGQTDLADYT
ncbi:hypothetical protein AB6A40_008787 [Gnathostoma spinigerum]|uniref:Gem-associated protein 2 n=1 Tax=Gnathostoma spinigerum TaxID=75299 RepID=A0ABD6EYC6_9BILA